MNMTGIGRPVSSLGYGLDDRGMRVPFRERHFSLLHSVHSGSGAHPASYKMSNGNYFLGGKAAGALSLLFTFI
jgi:hypothetical protein